MIPAAFEYAAPKTVDEALALMQKLGANAKVLAGGQSLLPMMKLRLANPAHVIDIGRIPNLRYIKEDGRHTLAIGTTTTHWEIESSDLLKKKCPLLAETAAQIGDVQVRNVGTIGGALAHADPAADYPAAILALEAEIIARGPKGTRTVKAGEFFKGIFTTALGADELLVEVRVPMLGTGTGGAYLKMGHPASGFAIVGCAAVVTVQGGKCASARVAFTGVSDRAFRDAAVEKAITGKALDAQSVAAAAEQAAGGVAPLSDYYASADYRSHLAKVFAKRALMKAVERAK
ncbi:MAG: xanthine dehydrogenase family protein subunit M [Armatimonadetes bacterium]|nr:xanthine dehydrogenase family protein subunit M [Armatimonadota bacterium]